ncbi:hypothetical protein Tco_0091395 [Tanacetum coccineum]
MDEEALKEMLEEEAMNKKAQEEKIRQEQAENDAFFLEFGVVKMSYLVPLIAIVFVVVVSCYLASVPQEEDHQYIVAILGLIVPLIIVAINVEVFLEEVVFVCRCQFPHPDTSSLAVTSSGLSSDASDAGLPSEKVVASGKNGDDGDLLLFRYGPGACDVSAGILRELSGTLLESD